MQNELLIAQQACEERKADLLATVVPQVIDPNSIVGTWDKNGIKIPKAALIHIACFSGSYDCVKYLIQCRADVKILDELSRSPLYIASLAGYTQIVHLLLNSGADPDVRDVFIIFIRFYYYFSWSHFFINWTALHRASLWSHLEIIKALQEKGANLNACDETNWTPLHVAVKWDRMQAVELLLSYGANVNIKNDVFFKYIMELIFH